MTLTCPYFGGTYDLLCSINQVPYLIDFKTSNHITYKYYLQLAAYSYLLKDQQGINIGGVVILQLSKKNPTYKEYVLDLSNKQHKEYFDMCDIAFKAILYSYHYISRLEMKFNELQTPTNRQCKECK